MYEGVAAMIAAAELRAGMVIDLEGVRYRVVAAETHLGGGKAGAMVHARLARLDTGSVTERRLRPDEKLANHPLDLRQLDFLYQDGDDFVFMDPSSFDQFPLPRPLLGSFARFLKEGMRLQVDFLGEQAAVVRLPETADLKVIVTGEAQHARETSALKQAELENGMTIQVPLFIARGEVVRVNVETGRYVERVKEKKG